MSLGIGIGVTKFQLLSSFDNDAKTYFIATGINTPSVQTAINNFVIGLKGQGLWTKLYAFYPIIGNLTQSSYNLVNPSNYRVTWGDTPTVSSNTIAFNGTTQYGDTSFSPISVSGFSMSDVSFGLWDATGFNSRTEVPMGTTQNSGFDRIRAVWFSTNNNILDIMSNNSTAARVVFTPQNVGFWHFQRLGSNTKVFKDGLVLASSSNAGDVSVTPTNKIFLGATSDGTPGANTPTLYSQKTYKFFYIGKGLLDTEVSALNTLVNTLNTQLGR